ncbi:hypothetical protein A2Y83_02315 [Candidatus Falkowbacteria bacterium RBG_13_39_14]|uniref:Uncharacterized protein n=1 Tax=Candidatus Falkowbacteria bacterium RBG_13_39_14 TaxID=1797985 RepID=A0A1F5S3T0_9BACT|nr:MAG: hypothetical protein A2Y83_02315 [Candidatus Falkowbacteria bacterium RBG_13_39_14]
MIFKKDPKKKGGEGEMKYNGELAEKLAKFIENNLAAERIRENIDYPELLVARKVFCAEYISRKIGCHRSTARAIIRFIEEQYPDKVRIYWEKSLVSDQRVKKIRFLRKISAQEISSWSKWRKEMKELAESFAEKFFSGKF